MAKRWLFILVALMMASTATAFAQMAPVKIGNSAAGKVLTNEQGMTLYTFDKDSNGKSACNGTCAANWPPLTASASAQPGADYTVVSRDDGTKQWAYKGKPLYTWKNDKQPGDTTGNGVANGAWHIAQP